MSAPLRNLSKQRHTARGHNKSWQRHNERRRLRCLSDIRGVRGEWLDEAGQVHHYRWFNMETEAAAYWDAKRAAYFAKAAQR